MKTVIVMAASGDPRLHFTALVRWHVSDMAEL
jgi:hypothetical protein